MKERDVAYQKVCHVYVEDCSCLLVVRKDILFRIYNDNVTEVGYLRWPRENRHVFS